MSDDYFDQMAARFVQDALSQGIAATWERRARMIEWARPTPQDFPGQSTELELRRKWHELTLIARNCRHRATLALEDQTIAEDVMAAVRGEVA
ncbi:hypothetical protein [Nocardioides massiliensis]|uniref:Uncharacterized protein n=1 Tax=Nocardioides massiliensis TaxID=1325935 RepID=A0ABT9NQR2_9ACTN|nr:hypothetical protein [Nocardioides massiliensis]MDP9822773.1 hypothetical protein [Nocardioides massiliensis]